MREAGWYFVVHGGEWSCAFWAEDEQEWYVIGCEISLEERVFDKVGPKIELPNEADAGVEYSDVRVN